VRLVQMPSDLVQVEEADLEGLAVDPALLVRFRSYLPSAVGDRRGAAILGAAESGTRALLMLLARRVGAALRDENIRLRESGGDLKAGRKKLCYLPGNLLPEALGEGATRRALCSEAACFIQDLAAPWESPGPPPTDAVLGLLDARLAADLPTFVTADPAGLSAAALGALRSRLAILESG
jgi:hypothetical protein